MFQIINNLVRMRTFPKRLGFADVLIFDAITYERGKLPFGCVVLFF